MRFLMSYPEFFTVNYEINSWMNVKKKPDTQEAIKQWRRLFQILITLGVHVEDVGSDERYPDLVFTANAGVVKGRGFIPSNFRHPERQGESAVFEKWFAEHGYWTQNLPEGYFYEGAGDVLPLDDFYVAGYGFRSNRVSYSKLTELLDISVVPVELTNSYFYHLDTC